MSQSTATKMNIFQLHVETESSLKLRPLPRHHRTNNEARWFTYTYSTLKKKQKKTAIQISVPTSSISCTLPPKLTNLRSKNG